MSSVDTMRFICGGCGYRARIPTSYTGKVILCPGCQQMQIANADGGEATGDTVRVNKVATAQGTGKFSVPDADGRLRFTCGGCGYSAKLASTYAGKAISCPQRKSPQLIPPLQGSEGAGGKAQAPSSALEPAGGPADDGLTFDDEPAAQATAAAPVAPKAAPAEKDPADEISFDLEPAEPAPAARSAPGASDNDATKPTAAAAASQKPGPQKPAPAKPTAGAKPSTKPGSGGVVRRGSRMPLPAAPTATDEDEEAPEESDEPAKPKKQLPPWAQNLTTRLKEPRIMAMVGGCAAALILQIVLINGWVGASNDAADFRKRAEANETRAKDLDKKQADTEFTLSKTTEDLNRIKKTESDAKAALAAAETRLSEMAEALKKAEADKADEYTRRKKAEAEQDEMFTKLKAIEKKRDEEYRISTELRSKYEEETKLRKALKQRLDEAQAAAK
jgi:ribosomal protein S27AE